MRKLTGWLVDRLIIITCWRYRVDIYDNLQQQQLRKRTMSTRTASPLFSALFSQNRAIIYGYIFLYDGRISLTKNWEYLTKSLVKPHSVYFWAFHDVCSEWVGLNIGCIIQRHAYSIGFPHSFFTLKLYYPFTMLSFVKMKALSFDICSSSNFPTEKSLS